jgi:hypothetical protein
MKKLQLWCMNANMKLEQISRELQILEHRRTLEASGNNQRPTESKPFLWEFNQLIVDI